MRWQVNKAVSPEVIEAHGYRIAEGGALVLYEFVQPAGGQQRQATVKAFAPHAWWSIEPAADNGRTGDPMCDVCGGRGYVGPFSATHGAPCPTCGPSSGSPEAQS
jgi:hypothetical protein